MNRKLLGIFVCLLFFGASIVSGINIELKSVNKSSRGVTLYVGGSGPGNYTKIQDAVDNASDGDTVFVYDDSSPYYEKNIVIDKPLNLIGEDKNTTIIDGEGANILYTNSNWLNISYLHFSNANHAIYSPGISNYKTITNNIITNASHGIYFWEGNNYNTISNNIITKTKANGMYFKNSNYNIIFNNIFSNNTGSWCINLYTESRFNTIFNNTCINNEGMVIRLYNHCNRNTIYGNIISNNNDEGIMIYYSQYNNIHDNIILNQKGYGIYVTVKSDNNILLNNIIKKNSYYGIHIFFDCDNNNIINNTISHNDNNGIYLLNDCQNNKIINNTISHNTIGIVITNSCPNNLIYNNYLHNNINALDTELNIWNISKTQGLNIIGGPFLGGNCYNDYNGEDADGDGIGDTPYDISSGSNKDYLPLYKDFIPPEINNVTANPNPQFSGGHINITCNVIDNDAGVDEVKVDIIFPDSTSYNHSMFPSYYLNQTYTQTGIYQFQIWVNDTNGNNNMSTGHTFQIFPNNPPSSPTITGPTNGKPNTEYSFTFVSTDPDGDAVMYNVDWGDGDTDWTEYGDSGAEITLKHTWTSQGTYTIMAQAVDIHGAESDWTEFPITIPRNKAINNPLLNWLQSHPNLFPLLQKLIQSFGLIVTYSKS